ncbi:MAG TPA: nucleoside 2-deoxyribosyltransferase [Thermoleophilaceae bacterium]|nr:nucleoside 2-deoxyribosyltransferase [Thermoleophilaceae bacterium]
MAGRPAVYLASPLGFSETTRSFGEQVVVPALIERGFAVLDPWHDEHGAVARQLQVAADQPNDADRQSDFGRVNRDLGARNVRLIEQSDALLAVLDGPDVDSGTAAEIGYAAALGRPIVGWRSDIRRAGENEATPVNMQVAHFISTTGGRIAETLDSALDALEEALAREGPG